MKSTSTLFAFIFLSAFISPTLGEAVLDTDGNPLENGGTYYILPAGFEAGGGIERIATGTDRCPLTVVQSPSERSKGLPVTMSTPYRILYLSEGFPFGISFDSPPPACAREASTWTLVREGPREGVPSIKLAKHAGGSFKIERAGLDYKLGYCYDYSYERRCSDIGIRVDDDGNRRLVANIGDPFVVQFKRASSPSSSA